jgi:hypothetical protein
VLNAPSGAQLKYENLSGGHSVEETPVPIPNTEVKLYSADDTRKGKVGHCQDYFKYPSSNGGLFYSWFDNISVLCYIRIYKNNK